MHSVTEPQKPEKQASWLERKIHHGSELDTNDEALAIRRLQLV